MNDLDILKAQPIEQEPDRSKIKWPKRRKHRVVKGKTECKKLTYHPGTNEARQILEQAGRSFLYCEECNIQDSTAVHHVDGNPFNNSIENLRILCQMCHARIHGIDEAEVVDEFAGIPIVDE
jgi:5-methylcytosine-specific restriction endonuclease McrA